MNEIRAYNMNLNELIRNDTHDKVSEQRRILSGTTSLLKADNDDSSALKRIDDARSVEVVISPIWQEVADKLDLQNASANEVAELSSSLFNAGAISFEDHIELSFSKGTEPDKKINYIAYWQERQEIAIRHGAVRAELNDIIRIQSIIGYVDNLSRQ